MADIEIPGTSQKIPTWVLIVGGIGAFALALIARKQSGSNAPTQEDTSALLTSELTQQMQEGWQSVIEWMRYQMNMGQGTVNLTPPGSGDTALGTNTGTAEAPGAFVKEHDVTIPPWYIGPPNQVPPPSTEPPPEYQLRLDPGIGFVLPPVGKEFIGPPVTGEEKSASALINTQQAFIGPPIHSAIVYPGGGGEERTVRRNNADQSMDITRLPSGKFPGFASLARPISYDMETPATRGSRQVSLDFGDKSKGVIL